MMAVAMVKRAQVSHTEISNHVQNEALFGIKCIFNHTRNILFIGIVICVRMRSTKCTQFTGDIFGRIVRSRKVDEYVNIETCETYASRLIFSTISSSLHFT